MWLGGRLLDWKSGRERAQLAQTMRQHLQVGRPQIENRVYSFISIMFMLSRLAICI
jgi:hypothetical protein